MTPFLPLRNPNLNVSSVSSPVPVEPVSWKSKYVMGTRTVDTVKMRDRSAPLRPRVPKPPDATGTSSCVTMANASTTDLYVTEFGTAER